MTNSALARSLYYRDAISHAAGHALVAPPSTLETRLATVCRFVDQSRDVLRRPLQVGLEMGTGALPSPLDEVALYATGSYLWSPAEGRRLDVVVVLRGSSGFGVTPCLPTKSVPAGLRVNVMAIGDRLLQEILFFGRAPAGPFRGMQTDLSVSLVHAAALVEGEDPAAATPPIDLLEESAASQIREAVTFLMNHPQPIRDEVAYALSLAWLLLRERARRVDRTDLVADVDALRPELECLYRLPREAHPDGFQDAVGGLRRLFNRHVQDP